MGKEKEINKGEETDDHIPKEGFFPLNQSR